MYSLFYDVLINLHFKRIRAGVENMLHTLCNRDQRSRGRVKGVSRVTATRPSGEQAGAQSRAERSGCHHIRTAELTVWDRVLEETQIQYWERSGITSFILSGCSCKDCSKRSSFIWNVCANNDDVTTCHLRSIRPGSTHVQCKTPHILWWESGCCREEGGSWTVILKTVCSLLYIWLRERQVKRSNIHVCDVTPRLIKLFGRRTKINAGREKHSEHNRDGTATTALSQKRYQPFAAVSIELTRATIWQRNDKETDHQTTTSTAYFLKTLTF